MTETNAAQLQHPQSAPALLAYHVPQRSRVPAGVLVLAMLGFVLATLGTIVHALFLIVLAADLLGASDLGEPGAVVPGFVIALLSLVFWAMLVRACMAAIRMRPRARWGMVRWASIYLMWVVVSGVAVCTVVTEAELGGVPVEFAREYRQLVYARTATISGFEAIYPVVVILYMVRRKVLAAFETPAELTGGGIQGYHPRLPNPALPVLAVDEVATREPTRGAEP